MNIGYDYVPTSLDDEMFLSEIPIEMIQNSIEDQFEDPLEYRKKDYVQSFISKYNFNKDNMLEDDEISLENDRDNFMIFMQRIFSEYLSVGFNELDSLDVDEQHELIHMTYRFFIKNIKKNFVNLIINYIYKNKDDIFAEYENKKDVTSLSFQAEIDDEFEILVISHLGNIIDTLLSDIKENIDVDEFFDLCEKDEPILEVEYVREAYNNFQLTGNFIPYYVDMIDETFKIEIQQKVRNKILKKYPKRIRKSNAFINDEEEDVEQNIDELNEDE